MGEAQSHRRRWIVLALAASFVVALTAMAGTASARDRNHDKIPDRWEKHHRLSLQVDQASRDQDSDAMPNLGEYEAGLDPRDEDSDGDGIPDGEEMAGEVASFTPGTEAGTGTLVIDLYAGGQLSGSVTADTRIICAPDAAADDGTDGEAAPASGRQGPPPSGTPGQTAPTGQTGPSGQTAPSGQAPAGPPRPPASTDEDEDTAQGPAAGHGSGGDCPRGQECTTDDLVAGTVVHEAEVNVSANGNKFRVVALGS